LSGGQLHLSRRPAHPAPTLLAAILAFWFLFVPDMETSTCVLPPGYFPWRATSITGAVAKSLRVRIFVTLPRSLKYISSTLAATDQ
jgi:hypothetical protein